MEWASGSDFLITLLQIVAINIVLSGDNAVVIALACRSLPPRQQRKAFLLGAAGVVVLMAILTAFASYLLSLPYLEIGGSVVLLWIGIKLLLPEDESGRMKESRHLLEAVKTIIDRGRGIRRRSWKAARTSCRTEGDGLGNGPAP